MQWPCPLGLLPGEVGKVKTTWGDYLCQQRAFFKVISFFL